jgi:hypothetical protein
VNPQELQTRWRPAFLEFTQAASSTSSAAFNSTSLQEGTLLYRGFYDLRDFTGELTATLVDSERRWRRPRCGGRPSSSIRRTSCRTTG